MEIKFKEIIHDPFTNNDSIPISHQELSRLILKQKSILSNISSRYSFETILKNCGIDGEFENETGFFTIFSFGLPNCITKVSFIPCDQQEFILGQLDLSKSSGLKCSNLSLGPKNQNDLSSLLKVLRNYIRLLTIWEQFNLLQDSRIEIESLLPQIKLEYQNISFTLNENGDIIVTINEERSTDLECLFESESFSIYDFIDKLLETNTSNDVARKSSEASPDLTWLSDSFM